jgi:hypothetical protein
VNRAHALALQLALEPEVEVGRVDADEQRDVSRAGARAQLAANAQQLRQVRDDLGEAAHRELLERIPRVAAAASMRGPRCRRSARSGSARGPRG